MTTLHEKRVAQGIAAATRIRELNAAKERKKARGIGSLVRCSECGRRGNKARQRYRLNPVNLHPTWRLLCSPCGLALGYAPEWDRLVNSTGIL